MSNSIDQLLNLQGYDLSILSGFIKLINSASLDNNLSHHQVLARLMDSERVRSHFENDDPDKVDTIRRLIVETLADERSIEFLTEEIKDYSARYLAVTMLGWYRSRARGALPTLTGIVGNSGSSTGAAKLAIILIGEGEDFVLEQIKISLDDRNDGAFRELCDLVRRANYRCSPEFIEYLRRGAASDDPNIREVAADNIGLLDSREKRLLLPILERLRHDPVDCVRQAAEDSACAK